MITYKRIFGVLCVLLLSAGIGTATAAPKNITIGVNNWAENVAVANLWKLLLEEHGYDVTLTSAAKAIVWAGVARGDMQFTLEAWLPTADGPYYHRFQKHLEKIGPWFKAARLGLVVPDYVKLNSIDQLNAHAASFKHDGLPAIYGIDPGSSLMGLTHKAVKDYGLHYQIVGSSESAMLVALKRSYRQHKPIIVTLWNPHWIWATLKLKYLDDPKGVYGKPDSIYAVAHKGFSERYPQVAAWLARWHLSNQSLGSLMNTIRKSGSDQPAQGARQWLNAHRKTVKAWFAN